MKRKSLAVVLVMIIVLSMFNGCGKENSQTTDNDTVYGEVSKIESDTITIKVGTQKEMEKSSKGNGKSKPSMLELTGEEQEIKITDDTVIKKLQRGGRNGEKMGNPPEQQSGNQADGNNETPPEIPSDEKSDNKNQGNPPQMPEGESGMLERESMSEQTEEISLEDISKGDTVKITFEDDGNAKEITVMSMGGGMGHPEGGQEEQSAGVDNYTAVQEYASDTTADLSGVSSATAWSDYKIEKLSALK